MDEELLSNLHTQVSVLERDIKYMKSETVQLESILRQKDEEIMQERAHQGKLLQEKNQYLSEIQTHTKEIDDMKNATESERRSSNDLQVTRQKLLQDKQAQEADYRECIGVCDSELKRLEELKRQKDINCKQIFSDAGKTHHITTYLQGKSRLTA